MLLVVAVIVAVGCSVTAATSKQSVSNLQEVQAVQLNVSSAAQHNNSSILEDNITSTLSLTSNTFTSTTEGRQANATTEKTLQRCAARLLEAKAGNLVA